MGRLHLGTILGTTIAVDFSFVIVIAFFVLFDTRGMPEALLWAPVIFISILFHELAHAAMIAIFGYGSSEIVLGGFGGVTMNRRNAKHWQDMLISAAGPAASFLLAGVAWFLLLRIPYLQHDRFFLSFIPLLNYANVLWGEFNLVPMIPLDGSGVLRNFLGMFLRDRTAFLIGIWASFLSGAGLLFYAALRRDIFFALFVLWFLRITYEQWVFYKKYNRTDL
jgi:Zn-dependent protease